MYFKQFYLGCLAHASYLIGSDGEAAVVDPQRDVDQYIEEAERQGLKIKFVVETHLHADFVSGHHELAERVGAKIVFGAKAGVTFEHGAVQRQVALSPPFNNQGQSLRIRIEKLYRIWPEADPRISRENVGTVPA